MTTKTLTKKQEMEEARNDARKRLHTFLDDNPLVYTVLKHVSSSGMTRHISCYCTAINEGTGRSNIVDITFYVARLLGYRRNYKDGGLVVGGCGMDMGFHVVYSLSSLLFREGFKCFGKDCGANDHNNDHKCDRVKGKHHHRDGGYALRHEWL